MFPTAFVRGAVAISGMLTLVLQGAFPAQTQLEGRISYAWSDSSAPSRLALDVYLTPESGVPTKLTFAPGREPLPSQLEALRNGFATATGSFDSTPLRASEKEFHASRIESSGDPAGTDPIATAAAGPLPYVTIRCRFGDSTTVDRPLNTSLFSASAYPSMEYYWREVSYGAVDMAGSIITPWLNLPQPRSYYVYAPVAGGRMLPDLARLTTDCTAAADSTVDFTRFAGINLLFNQGLTNPDAFLAMGGSWTLPLEGTTRSWRTIWYGSDYDLHYKSFATMAHEVGHSLGFGHSSPSGSQWDVMSSAANHYEPSLDLWIPMHTIMVYKDLGGWIPASRRFTARRLTTSTIVIERSALPVSSTNYLMAVIPIPGNTRYYTVETRMRVGHDSWVPGNAVIIHRAGLDIEPGVVDGDNNGNLNDAGAMWTAGEVFTDAANGIRVSIDAMNASSATVTIAMGTPARATRDDFDGDGYSDLVVFRPSSGSWYVLKSAADFTAGDGYVWGVSSDLAVPADYDGDRRTDIAVYRPSAGHWFVLESASNFTTWGTYQWGTTGDIPVPADFDGDGRADLAIYRPSSGMWYLLKSGTGFSGGAGYAWGGGADIPVPGDYDGDGRADIAVYRPSSGHWFVLRSSANYADSITYQWGTSGDIPVPGDYDGDRRTDLAIYRPATGTWIAVPLGGNAASGVGLPWGGAGDVPVPRDYDGDGKTDLAVFRPSSAHWFVRRSSANFNASTTYQWGTTGDVPISQRH